jgi:hypothetical protein
MKENILKKAEEIKPEQLNLLEELGGPQGIADSSIPSLVFVVAFTISKYDLQLAAVLAVVAGIVLGVIRLIKGEALRFVLAGFAGIALAAFIANKTGRAEDFFLPGIILNGGYALVYLVSIFINWPLIGLIVETATGNRTKWRQDKLKLAAYKKASFIWVLMFSLRLAVQLPLYFLGAVVALGIVKTIMGFPLFILAVWLSWIVLKKQGINIGDLTNAFGKKPKEDKDSLDKEGT